MYLGPFHRAGSLSVADPDTEQPSTSGQHPVDNRVDSLISRIRPARHSESRRHRIAQHVSILVARCFPADQEVEAFMFGSVPLKTYLPDGDIDLSVFQAKGHSLRDSWATQLSSVLEAEQRDPYAPFAVRDVQVIHAEVKLLKCLVDNVVVDISFETLGGLCTVAFLEAMDRHIGSQHLFKRSVILVKAWCYYESRLLGAPHGLLSTYALETMVLYIFNFYHNSLQTPCQVLHKFLDVFSQFDWDKYCLSLQGPITLSSFPNPSVETPSDTENLLLSSDTIAEMLSMYSPTPLPSDSTATLNASSRNFAVKFLNIMDPLLPTNNLGRSVSKASFARIRKALKHGAQTLTDIMLQDDSHSLTAVDKFFKNTWNAQRPLASTSPHSVHQQQMWLGNSSKPAHGLQGLSPQQLHFLSQQYQQHYMLQHLQLQQQQHQMSRLQHQPPAYLSVHQTDLHRDGQGRPQTHAPRQQYRQSMAANNGTRPHTEPPTRVASPFAVESAAHQLASQQIPAEYGTPSFQQPPVPPTDAKSRRHSAASHGDLVNSHASPDAHQTAASQTEGTSDDALQQARNNAQPSEPVLENNSDQQGASSEREPQRVHDTADASLDANSVTGDASPQASAIWQAGNAHEDGQSTSAQPCQTSASDAQSTSTTAVPQGSASLQPPQMSQTSSQPQLAPPSQLAHASMDSLPTVPPQSQPASVPQLQSQAMQPHPQLQSIPQTQPQSTAESQSHSPPEPRSQSAAPHQHSAPFPPAHSPPQSHSVLHTAAESTPSSQPLATPPAVSMPTYVSSAVPMHMQPTPGYGTQMHLQPIPGSQSDMYPYGMVQLLHPSMLMLPQQQQHQHSKGSRNNRASAASASPTGIANGKHSPSAQNEQNFMMEMFPDLRMAGASHHPVHTGSQQLLDTADSLTHPSHDILAGNLDQLKLHLQIARARHAQKAAAASSQAGNHDQEGGQAEQPAVAPAHAQATSAGPAEARQQRKPQPTPYASNQRSRQQVSVDAYGSDRWLNDAQPPLHRSISPPVPPTYVPPPLLQQQYPPQTFFQMGHQDSSNHSQTAQYALQQQAARRGQYAQQQRLPRQHAAPHRSTSADNLQRHAIRPHANVEGLFGSEAARAGAAQVSHAVHEQQAEASGQDVLRGQSPQGWMQQAGDNSFPGLPGTPAALTPGLAEGPASVDSLPVLQGIWGNGMHQQRISNLASDLPAVKVTSPNTAASESGAATASTPAAQGREAAPSTSRSAGSTPCAREKLPGRGYSPFDGPAPFRRSRQRMTHNASAQELSQPGGNVAGPARRDRAPKLSLDSLTSQGPAEQAQRQQALANFDLQEEDFPALGGGKKGNSLAPATSLGKGRAAPGKAWSETDAVSPLLTGSSVAK